VGITVKIAFLPYKICIKKNKKKRKIQKEKDKDNNTKNRKK